jgi:hypothetical protein
MLWITRWFSKARAWRVEVDDWVVCSIVLKGSPLGLIYSIVGQYMRL